ncbi:MULTISPECIES: serine/threonine-protein kinase [unclassified Adlercreutzia]|uniref:serine/threonine protein kinase n=1 Tax=unclassified Adlercreutzia TaxID=2636013 RepID=UPI0013ECEBDF|nr:MULTISPECIES: serine/threonine-protein kinase [unclassified Adlercreutzia]
MAQVGAVVGGRYKIIEELGRGGMSVVWLASDLHMSNKQWAIKEIKENASTETHRVSFESLKKEAAIMQKLDKHDGIAQIVDIITEDSTLFVVMEHVPGEDLRDLLKKRGSAFALEDVLDWGQQICDALGYLHSQNVIYRDMKPGNVMLRREDGKAKIIDFGIAREYKAGKTDDTMPLGTRGYAPPESFKKGVQTDARSDIYSLGVTLFHLVTGYGPMQFIDRPTLPSIMEVNPALSGRKAQGLDNIIQKCTKWDPDQRYQSCDELWLALDKPEDQIEEHIQELKRKQNTFLGFAVAGVACLVLGIGCMAASAIVRGSSYDSLMERAAVASTAEVGDQASPAESLYVEAIDVSPDSIEPYSNLVNEVYKDDSAFTTSESSRWAALFEANKGSISDSADYAKLCYDAGIDYFIYFSYGDELTRGSQAVTWFNYAIESYDSRTGKGQPCTLSDQERRAAEVYKTIGEFSQTLSRATQEGTEGESYATYWDALEQACTNLDDSDPVIVRLRLYDVVFQAINSPVYLNGFRRAGISESRVDSLLQEVYQQTLALAGDANKNELTNTLYETIVSGYPNAANNVKNTYNNIGVLNQGSASGSSDAAASSTAKGAN